MTSLPEVDNACSLKGKINQTRRDIEWLWSQLNFPASYDSTADESPQELHEKDCPADYKQENDVAVLQGYLDNLRETEAELIRRYDAMEVAEHDYDVFNRTETNQ